MIEGAASARAGPNACTGDGFGVSVIIGGMRSAEKRVLNAVCVLRVRAAPETSVAARASVDAGTLPRSYGRSGGTGTGPRGAARLPNDGRNGRDEASRIGDGAGAGLPSRRVASSTLSSEPSSGADETYSTRTRARPSPWKS